MFNHVAVIKRNSTELVLARSKVKAFFELSFHIVFFGFWYSFLIDDFSSLEAIKQSIAEKVSEQKIFILFYLAPLIVGKRIILGVSTVFIGNRYIFSSTKRAILHNGKIICQFHQVKSIQIRRIVDSDGADTFRLVVIYSDRNKLFIAENTDKFYINSLASDIADACETKIRYKD